MCSNWVPIDILVGGKIILVLERKISEGGGSLEGKGRRKNGLTALLRVGSLVEIFCDLTLYIWHL